MTIQEYMQRLAEKLRGQQRKLPTAQEYVLGSPMPMNPAVGSRGQLQRRKEESQVTDPDRLLDETQRMGRYY